MAIKKGDTVLVQSGKSRGVKAKVLRVAPKDGTAIVEGVNMAKRHQKARQQNQKGQIVERPMPVKLSALLIVCPACGTGRRMGAKVTAGGKKVRVCVKCGTEL